MSRPTGADSHLAEAGRLLQSPDFFGEGTPPAAITFTGGKNFQFPSPIVSPFPANNLVTGRISRCGKHWRKRPAVVILHGWNDSWGYRHSLPWIARRFNRRGINSVMFELPYHFQRRPSRTEAKRDFISEDVGRTLEAIHQALAEINSIVSWILQQGCPRVALLGISMGAWLGGLAACHDPRISCVALITPVSRIDRMIEEAPFCETIRQALKSKPMDLSRLNLSSHKPGLSRGFILLVQAEYDMFVPADTTEELWEAWGNPELWRLPQGHITTLWASSMMKRATKWIGLRLKIPEPGTDDLSPGRVLG
jgi:pimeloyl-ACP methyl ester carboxylesterase